MYSPIIQTSNFEEKKQTVNKSVKICVNCGNIPVLIENQGIFCKECGTFYKVKEDKK